MRRDSGNGLAVPVNRSRKALVACEVFASELRHVMPGRPDVRIELLPAALHTDMNLLEDELDRALASCREDGAEEIIVLYGAACSPA